MIKICETCEKKFETKSATRIYCYDCSFSSGKIERVAKVSPSWVKKVARMASSS